ncbi:MAG: sialate O-acetylesterase, partial [Tannerellaceae bacterium]|nr:sialate O-acetylesterase [Tannerellaceae bacterium]
HPHVYTIPAGTLKKGKNIIAIRLFSFWGTGMLGCYEQSVYLENKTNEKIILDTHWKMSATVDPVFPETPPYMNEPAALYNAMIHPIRNYTLKGIIWYQGETNAHHPEQYRTLFPLLINDWRIRFRQGMLPFLFVQLANYGNEAPFYKEDNWAFLREAQTCALSLPHTGMATAIDIGMAHDIHPKNKKEVGRRLYLQAAEKVYGDSICASGPVFEKMEIENNLLYITFRHAAGLHTKGDPEVKGFYIAGKDAVFYPADQAIIQGNQVILSSGQVPVPVAVRYAWASNPACNLYNQQDLPAIPFRTDSWERILQ